jgi:hypothetical protein
MADYKAYRELLFNRIDHLEKQEEAGARALKAEALALQQAQEEQALALQQAQEEQTRQEAKAQERDALQFHILHFGIKPQWFGNTYPVDGPYATGPCDPPVGETVMVKLSAKVVHKLYQDFSADMWSGAGTKSAYAELTTAGSFYKILSNMWMDTVGTTDIDDNFTFAKNGPVSPARLSACAPPLAFTSSGVAGRCVLEQCLPAVLAQQGTSLRDGRGQRSWREVLSTPRSPGIWCP